MYKEISPTHHRPFDWWMHKFVYTFLIITKTCLYNFDPLKPHFYIVKLGFTGVYIIFLFLLKIIDCGYSLELPHQGSSNEYPQSMFWAEIWKNSGVFIWKFSVFLEVKFSLYLNRRVFVMLLKQWLEGVESVKGQKDMLSLPYLCFH